jgi:hypothetical protein
MRGESILPFLAAILTVVAAVLITSPFSSPAVNGRSTFNLDPTFSASNNDLVWDPNTEPGVNSTPGLHVNWSDPTGGIGSIDYYVGPWSNGSVAPLPHFAVGPQAFNFVEVPRTQQYRNASWGDYQRVEQGFRACAVNQGDLTVGAAQAVNPIYVGMPEQGVDWGLAFTIDWTPAVVATGLPALGLVALTATTTLPPLPGQPGARLVYTQLVIWASSPAPELFTRSGNGSDGPVGVGEFPVDQLPNVSVQRAYTLDLSPYLSTTLTELGLGQSGALLSYVYLETDGYNVHLRLDLRDLYVTGPTDLCGSALVSSLDPNPASLLTGAPASALVAASAPSVAYGFRVRHR